MTSQLKVDRISPATGSEIIIDGLDIPEPTESPIKAWVNFNGTGTVAIRDGMNVSSITDVGVGIYTVNFMTEMPDVNYCPQLTPGAGRGEQHRVQTTTTTGFNLIILGHTNDYEDSAEIYVLVVR